MKLNQIVSGCVAILFSSICAAADPQVIIDTNFSRADRFDRLMNAPTPKAPGAGLPLNGPTFVTQSFYDPAYASSLKVGTAPLENGFNPPYLRVHIGLNPQKQTADGGKLLWDLSLLKLNSGVYEVDFDLVPFQNDKGGFLCRLVFGAGDGSLASHPMFSDYPGFVVLQNSGKIKYVAKETGETRPARYNANTAYHIHLQVDLDKRVWSLAINGNDHAKNIAFPGFLVPGDQGAFIKGFEVSAETGWGIQPDQDVVLANLVLKRVN